MQVSLAPVSTNKLPKLVVALQKLTGTQYQQLEDFFSSDAQNYAALIKAFVNGSIRTALVNGAATSPFESMRKKPGVHNPMHLLPESYGPVYVLHLNLWDS